MNIEKPIVKSLYITQPFDRNPVAVEKMELFFEGVKHDKHFGISKIAGVRESKIISKGTPVLNIRAVTIVSAEELSEIAKKLDIKNITAADLEANIEIEGIPNLTQLKNGTMLKFPRNTVLYITGENYPCIVVGGHLAKRLKDKNLTWKFPKAALHLRGVTALVYSCGTIKKGDEVEVIEPNSFN